MRPLVRSSSVGILVAAGALLQSPVRAENPKLNLRVENVTAVEAAAQLAKAAGVPVEIQGRTFPAGVQPTAAYRLLQEKATFDWNGKTLAAALRDLSNKYQLRPTRQWGGFLLFPGGAPPPPPEQKVGATEKDGVKLSVRRVTVRNNRTLDFSGAAVAQDDQAVSIELHADLGEGDGDLIAGLENVVAMDDRGNLLVSDRLGGRLAGVGYTANLFPNEWASTATLSGAHPRATRIAWLEGDLIAYGSARSHSIEAPLPLPAEGFKKNAGEILAEVIKVEPGAGAAGSASASGPVVTILVQFPAGAPGGVSSQDIPTPLLVGASGTIYTPSTTQQSNRRIGAAVGFEITARFAAIQEAPKAVRMNVVERKAPHRLFNFRLQDIPMPAEGAFLPRRAAIAVNPTNPAAARAFYQKGGGTLITSVKINEQAPPEGILALGLAPKTGPEAGSVRWIDAPIGKGGTVTVPDVAPGKYRLLRTFQPRQDLRLAGIGRWENNEVEVTVEAGQDVKVPMLNWMTLTETPETKPATTDKPAATDKPATTDKPAVKKPTTKKKPVRRKPAPKKK